MEEPKEKESAHAPPVFIEAIQLEKSFEEGGVRALRGVSFKIKKGEMVSVTGPSGSGKSTLLQLLGTLDLPTKGDLIFEGRSMKSIPDLSAFRARSIGFIFQSFHLLPTLTALENVQIPMFEMPWNAQERVAKANELLMAVGLEQRKHHLPRKLSGGERQRVAIARSLANNPRLLLADEPTGNLDSQNAKSMMDLLRRIHDRSDTTMIIVTHDPRIALQTQRVIEILDGQVQSDAAPNRQ